MDSVVQNVVRQAVRNLIEDAVSDEKIRKSYKLHKEKIHFVPAKYRVIGGILQSLNIRFGNFIEQLIEIVVENETNITKHPISGKKINQEMTPETDRLIDEYITNRQLSDSPDQCDEQFWELLRNIYHVETTSSSEKRRIRHDVDTLFQTSDGQIVYLEVKYNDDHDTGKFVDINRKFLKTYAGLVNYLAIDKFDQFLPYIYYFNPTKRYGPIYVPSSNIYRGKQLFEKYFEMNFDDVDTYLRQIGDDETVIAQFDRLYQRIRHKL